jgi:ABC-type oligopeptide transport system substrate-binding subunit
MPNGNQPSQGNRNGGTSHDCERLTNGLSARPALDEWTLEVKVPPQALGLQVIYTAAWLYHYPKEVTETYGDMSDWKNVVGTGPYILDDYVSGSMLTFSKNDNYCSTTRFTRKTVSLHDTVKWMIIADASSQLAAFPDRALDFSVGLTISYEDGQLLLNQHLT